MCAKRVGGSRQWPGFRRPVTAGQGIGERVSDSWVRLVHARGAAPGGWVDKRLSGLPNFGYMVATRKPKRKKGRGLLNLSP